MHHIMRLVAMEIENIKNVGYGRLEFSQGKSGSILGIYGQNGSGKTVVVDCMVLLKCLLSGRRIPSHFYHYINALSKSSHVTYEFEIRTGEDAMFVQYEVELTKKRGEQLLSERRKTQHEEIKRGRKDTSDGGFRLSERGEGTLPPVKILFCF